MRILSLRFKNLNSLVGEWSIDFTHPDFDGLFAITGPTGAGKSTILDAICLGLYGSTPRLDRVTSGSNEIMSRLTGDCFSEVRFETEKGCFRSRWEQHRARNSPNGALQSPKHELCNDETGAILESKSRNVQALIESVTGMDFNRFTRSMLLAQGAFAAFLEASADERSPILEQITGTEIYSKISKKVFERTKAEETRLSNMAVALNEIRLLTPEEESQKRENLANNKKRREELLSSHKTLSDELLNLLQIDEIQCNLGKLGKDGDKLREEDKEFEIERVRLERGLKALEVKSIYEQVCDGRQRVLSLRAQITNAQNQYEKLKLGQTSIRSELESEKIRVDELLGQEPALLRLWDQVIQLDATLDLKKDQLTTEGRTLRGISEKLTGVEDKLHENFTQHEVVQKRLVPLENYQKTHAHDELLCEALTGIQADALLLDELEKKVFTHEENVRIETANLQAQRIVQEQAKEVFEVSEHNLERTKEELSSVRAQMEQLLQGRLLREYRSQEVSLQEKLTMRRIIASLEDHRNHLREGEPCPLCGALEHPYAQGAIPAVSELENQIKDLKVLILKIEDSEASLKKLEADIVKIETNNLKVQAKFDKERQKTLHIQERLAELENVLSQAKEVLLAKRLLWVEKVRPYMTTEGLGGDSCKAIVTELERRVKGWKDNVRELQVLREKLQKLIEEKSTLEVTQKEQREQYQIYSNRVQDCRKELEMLQIQRENLFGQKNPIREREIFNKQLQIARERLKHCEDQNHKSEQKNRQLEGEIQTYLNSERQEHNQLESNEREFVQAYQAANFATEKDFCGACLSALERERLQQKAEVLANRRTQWQTQLSDLKKRLNDCQNRKYRDIDSETLRTQIKDLTQVIENLLSEMATVEFELERNAEEKQRKDQQYQAFDSLKKGVQEWINLRELIGSADGKKYRNFVQGITFDVVIRHANEQLQRMSDRYLLRRGRNEALSLEVIDNYQAGEIRSTKNLSGGESFIVSLALALGLSCIVSEKVSVDSLFLDEGFGTLDEEALEMALDTLSQLRESGKLIGVISHVQALKDRIGTQIEVIVQNGGNSSLKGPGCTAITP